MTQQFVQIDPLDSPYPIPWSWVLATQAEHGSDRAWVTPQLYYYRTQALISPDGQYAAYSRVQMQVSSDLAHSQVSSTLFVENLRTRDLQTLAATSPFSNNPFAPNVEPAQAGMVAIGIPVAWSEASDRLLSREFESLFGSDIASDYAVVWERQSRQVRTLAPAGVQYTNAVLLGWSQAYPEQALFRVCNLGDPDPQLCSVALLGQTKLVPDDQPISFGQVMNNIWAGPQAQSQVAS